MICIFTKYAGIGVINTLIHWSVFWILHFIIEKSQAFSNFCGFLVAVTFSFFVNARWTFNSASTVQRYFLYAGFMGSMSIVFGKFFEKFNYPPFLMLVSFSMFSLISGFLYSKYIVFSENKK